MMNLAEKQELYLRARDAYYNDKPVMSDSRFDRLEDEIRAKCPAWGPLHKTGAKVKKYKVGLDHFMPSLSKAYPKDLPKWVKGHPSPSYLIMDKLDGSSLQVSYSHGMPVKVVTRGDGETGQDISFLIPDLNLPRVTDKTNFALRCEAVMSKARFKKWSKEFDNARNGVNGLLNRKKSSEPHLALKDIDIVVLGMFDVSVGWALKHARQLGLKAVAHKEVSNLDSISQHLAERKANSSYEIDGLVLCPADASMYYENSDRPKWATAYKENSDEDSVEAVVESVIYKVSNHRRIVPKIQIAPTALGGVIVRAATANNAKWMQDRKIGPGAVVKMVRSGGVIPKIIEVLKPGKFQPPKMSYHMEGVHFILSPDAEGEHNADHACQSILKFLRTLGCEFVAIKTIETLYAAGATTPFHYMKAAKTRNIEGLHRAGLGNVISRNIVAELERVFARVSLMKLMVASNEFGVGVGERRLTAIQAAGISMQMLLDLPRAKAEQCLLQIPGFQSRTAAAVLDGVPAFKKFLLTARKFALIVDEAKAKKQVKGKLTGALVSFTGYRNKDHESAIEGAGGLVVPFGSKTTLLLVKAGGKSSTKAVKAEERGIPVLHFEDIKF